MTWKVVENEFGRELLEIIAYGPGKSWNLLVVQINQRAGQCVKYWRTGSCQPADGHQAAETKKNFWTASFTAL